MHNLWRQLTKDKFPNISRFITELPRDKQIFYLKIFSVSFISTFLLVAIVFRGVTLFTTISKLQAAGQKKEALLQRKSYWENVIKEHDDYRDAYFQLAQLSYQLNEIEKARYYVAKSLELDPNFQPGKALEKQLGE